MFNINKEDLVRVCIYSTPCSRDNTNNKNFNPFDFATISFDRSEKYHKHYTIKQQDNHIDDICLYMRYDMAIQFLKRLHFSYQINDIDRECNLIREIWKSDVDIRKMMY